MKINLNDLSITVNGKKEVFKNKREFAIGMNNVRALKPSSFGIKNMPYEAHKNACIKFGYLTTGK